MHATHTCIHSRMNTEQPATSLLRYAPKAPTAQYLSPIQQPVPFKVQAVLAQAKPYTTNTVLYEPGQNIQKNAAKSIKSRINTNASMHKKTPQQMPQGF